MEKMIHSTKTRAEPVMHKDWSPHSWQTRKAKQQASYADLAALQDVLDKLSTLPPLVTS